MLRFLYKENPQEQFIVWLEYLRLHIRVLTLLDESTYIV